MSKVCNFRREIGRVTMTKHCNCLRNSILRNDKRIIQESTLDSVQCHDHLPDLYPVERIINDWQR